MVLFFNTTPNIFPIIHSEHVRTIPSSIIHNILVKHKYTRVFVSGCISGLVVSLIDTPFDLVKTQLQNQGSASQTSWFYRYLHVLVPLLLHTGETKLRSHLRCRAQRKSNGFNEFQNDKETLCIQRTSRAVPSEKSNHSFILLHNIMSTIHHSGFYLDADS